MPRRNSLIPDPAAAFGALLLATGGKSEPHRCLRATDIRRIVQQPKLWPPCARCRESLEYELLMQGATSQVMDPVEQAIGLFRDMAPALARSSRNVRVSWVLGSSWESKAKELNEWFLLLAKESEIRVERSIICPSEVLQKPRLFQQELRRVARLVPKREGYLVRFIRGDQVAPDDQRDVAFFSFDENPVVQLSPPSPRFEVSFSTIESQVAVIDRLLSSFGEMESYTNLEELRDSAPGAA